MTDFEAYLASLKASISDRKKGQLFVQQNPDYFEKLLALALNPKGQRVHVVASWVLEFVLLEDMTRLKPHWTYFLRQLPKIENESMRRPLSKILFYYVKNSKCRGQIPKREENKIVEQCFDWLIAPAETATLAFALKILPYYMDSYSWTREALKDLLQKGFGNEMPPGIRSAARRLLSN